MAKMWYPVINYELCTECGACFNKCTHGVFAKEEKRPVVIHTDGCVQGCHGCGNLCPTGAIEFVGDMTGWIPPKRKQNEQVDSGCCSGSGCCC